jgi:hypothetical protein
MVTPTTREGIEEGQKKHGAANGGRIMMQNEDEAASESIETGLYVTWIPVDDGMGLASDACDEVRSGGAGQCCRVRTAAACMCGHPLSSHAPVPPSTRSTFIKPPKCTAKACGCRCFRYVPDRPEECGQWWLPRRKDFKIAEWRKVCIDDLLLLLLVRWDNNIIIFLLFNAASSPDSYRLCLLGLRKESIWPWNAVRNPSHEGPPRGCRGRRL